VVVVLDFAAPLLVSVFFTLVVGPLVDILQDSPERAAEEKAVFRVALQPPAKLIPAGVGAVMVTISHLVQVAPAS
jgi:hypothetical protein